MAANKRNRDEDRRGTDYTSGLYITKGTVVRPTPFSPRQRQVIEGLVHGYCIKEIANTLELSIKTVQTHVTAIYHKTGATNTASLFRILAGEKVMDIIKENIEKFGKRRRTEDMEGEKY